MRLVDADSLLSHEHHAKEFNGEMLVIGKGYILGAPTVDAAPVRYGKWNVAYASGYVPEDRKPICSLCDCMGGWHSNYCPNCGADMKGESSNG